MPGQPAQPYLSIVIPAYNEQHGLAPTLQAIMHYVAGKSFAWEIVVVDDGSHDATSQVAEEVLAGTDHQLLRNDPNLGKALSVKRGLSESRGKIALFTDADLSTPIEEADGLLEAIENGFDIAIGSRQIHGSKIEVHQPWYRELAGRTFGLVNRIVLQHGIPDTQCGFKAFTRGAIDRILPHQRLSVWAFDAELMFIARRLGLTIAQIPVRWENDPDTKVKMLVDGPKMVCDLFRIRWLHRGLRGESSANGSS